MEKIKDTYEIVFRKFLGHFINRKNPGGK